MLSMSYLSGIQHCCSLSGTRNNKGSVNTCSAGIRAIFGATVAVFAVYSLGMDPDVVVEVVPQSNLETKRLELNDYFGSLDISFSLAYNSRYKCFMSTMLV